MIRAEELTIRAGAFRLPKISFTAPAGTYAVLMGRTGCGKTTLLETLCGLKRPESGRVFLFDREVTLLKPAERGIGYVPQDGALFPTMTVREHLSFALDIRRRPSGVIHARVAELAELLGLTALMQRKPAGLSGGEIQRVALGRALAAEPKVLCLDEPLGALDYETRNEMCTLLRKVTRETGVTTLHVTHDREEAARLAEYAFMLGPDGVRQS